LQLTRGGTTTDNHRADGDQAENQIIIPELLDLYPLLEEFRKRFASQLPSDVEQAIGRFTSKEGSFFKKSRTPGLGGGVILAALLCKVKAEVDYFLADKQVRARRAVDRAFMHLKRSIMADRDFRRKWMAAAKEKNAEVACEKLGALHLLLHGIWAFKADGKGGKTDLIVGGSIRDEDAVRVADAMVLTEWKMVRKNKDNPATRAREAFLQAEDYTRDTMAGFELSSHGYLVLVSDDHLTLTPEVPSPAKRTYEIINIAVNPSSPSKRARAVANRRAP